jgi:hypothetical protein
MAGPYSDELKQMLALAAIAYRGFYIPADNRALLLRAMTESLSTLAPVKDQWDIVWGPAAFSSTEVGFDDAAMYVARNRQEPATFAIAIRGTDPISATDWLFGDLLVTRQRPWAYDSAPNAKISLSTAWGLSVLQHLTADAPQLAAPGKAVTAPTLVAQAVADAPAWMQAVAAKASFAERIAAIEARRLLSIGVAARLDLLEDLGADPIAQMIGRIDFDDGRTSRITLKQFLSDAVKAANRPVKICVTGHSKGGALSPALALWLADTQGGGPVADGDQWDPERKATVWAYSFAGPTAGDGGFVSHCNDVLGLRCFRVVNALDVVPHAWNVDDLGLIPNLYPSIPDAERVVLKVLTGLVKDKVANLDYQHVGTGSSVIQFPGKETSPAEFFTQAIHQHLDGYLNEILDGEITAWDLLR